MEKGGSVWVMEGEKVRRDDPIEYFLPVGARKSLLSPRGDNCN